MPFTFSHPAIILPLNYLPKKWFSLTALVVGAMTPDFEYFIRMRSRSRFSHTWPGLFWFDLPLALMLVLVYHKMVKNKLIDHFPAYFNKRLSALKNQDQSPVNHYWIVIIISILTGGASHIVWDDFTHFSGYFVQRIDFLTEWISFGNSGIHVFNLLQHLSTLVGGLAILLTIMQLPVGELTKPIRIINYWGIIFLTMLIVLAARFHNGIVWHRYSDVIVSIISGALIGLLVASVVTPAKKTS